MSWTVTRRPFQSPVAFAMSSPTFLGDYRKSVSQRPTGFYGAACPCFIHPTDLILAASSLPNTRLSQTPQNFPSHAPIDTDCVPALGFLQILLCTDTPALMTITYETKGTDLGRQSGRGTDLTTGRSEVDNLFEMSNLGRPRRSIDYHEIEKGKGIVVQ